MAKRVQNHHFLNNKPLSTTARTTGFSQTLILGKGIPRTNIQNSVKGNPKSHGAPNQAKETFAALSKMLDTKHQDVPNSNMEISAQFPSKLTFTSGCLHGNTQGQKKNNSKPQKNSKILSPYYQAQVS